MIACQPSIEPGKGDALLVVDLQNDFLPAGQLPVPEGNGVIPELNRYLRAFGERALPVFLSRDWHPPDHCSFEDQGGQWPAHCVQGTAGAEFAAALEPPPGAVTISKATRPTQDAYSAFEGTTLHDDLQKRSVTRLFVGGLATDYCVLYSVRDALKLGYAVVLITRGMRAVDVAPGDGDQALQEMIRLGAVPCEKTLR